MELTKTNSFDPTPKLKSSPVPISFIPFINNCKDKCDCCGFKFSKTYSGQKYCKNGLTSYIKNLTDNNTYLDVRISTTNIQCSEHEPRNSNFYTHNIQDWCVICSRIFHFKQMVVRHSFFSRKFNPSYNKLFGYCKLCEKSINRNICSDCYLISSEWIESTFIKKSILYLPWWDASDCCLVCTKHLKIIADCQKWCSNCFVIYTGCR